MRAWPTSYVKKLAAKEHTREIARQVADYCRKMNHALETVSISLSFSKGMLTVLRVTVLAHSNGTLKLQTNLGQFSKNERVIAR